MSNNNSRSSTHPAANASQLSSAPMPGGTAAPNAIQILRTDPALAWVATHCTTDAGYGRSRALLSMVASAIALAVMKYGDFAIGAARRFYTAMFVRQGTAVGSNECRRMFNTSLRGVVATIRERDVRELHRLGGLYEEFVRFGLPKEVAAEAARDGHSVVERVRRHVEALDGSEPDEDMLEADYEDERSRLVLDPREHAWWRRLDNGEWFGPMPNAGLDALLATKGLESKRVEQIKKGVRHFERREPVFDSSAEIIDRGGYRVFNSYVPSDLRPIPGAWPDIYSVIMSLANGDAAFAEWLLDWLSMPVRSVHRDGRPFRTQVAFVPHGEPGAGKGTLVEVMCQIYGPQNCVTLGQEGLDGRFASQIRHKLLVNCNEVMSSSNRSAETSNKLKAWITDASIPLEQKHREAENAANYANFIFSSNDDAPVLISANDRRFVVKKSTRKLPEDISKRLYADIRGPRQQVAAFFHHLLNRPVRLEVGRLFETEDRKLVQLHTAPSEEKFWLEVKEVGWAGMVTTWQDEAPPGVPRDAFYGEFVPASVMAAVYQHYCKLNNLKGCGATKLAQALQKAFPGARPSFHKPLKHKMRGWCGIPIVAVDRGAHVRTAPVLPIHGSAKQEVC